MDDLMKMQNYVYNYFHEKFVTLNEMRENGKYCDFIIKSNDGVEFHVHKLVLAVASPHFDTMFNVDMQEKSQNCVYFPEFDSATLSVIVNYFYNGKITIDNENAQMIYPVAYYFELNWIVEKCESYLKKNLDCTNCFALYKLADLHGRGDLFKCCRDYMIQRFAEFVLDKTFLDMSYNEFKDLISNDKLYVAAESSLYETIIDWILYKLDKRRGYLDELISYVKFPLIGTNFLLQHTIEYSLKLNDFHMKTCLLEMIQNQLYNKFIDFDMKNHQQHDKSSSKSILFIPSVNKCRMYHLPHWNSSSIPSMMQRRSVSSTVYAKGKFFVLGGLNFQNEVVGFGEYYSPLTKTWSSIDNMPHPRYNFGACNLGDSIYACGGYGLSWASPCVQIYNMENGTWTMGESMNFFGFTRSVVISNAIHCFGEAKASRFDARENRWESLCYVAPCGKFCLVYDNDSCLYRIGANKNERFDIRNGKWETLCERYIYRSDHGAVKLGRYIFVFGGLNTLEENISIVEVYNVATDMWFTQEAACVNCPEASSAALYNP